MPLQDYIRAMPKVELHVHLEGAIRPATVLKLAQRHGITLPASTLDDLRQWYTFTDFPHFVEIYLTVSSCIRTPDDIELIAREFLQGQAEQNIRYTEVTYTAFTHYQQKGIPFRDQLAALNRARRWAESALGVSMGLIIDVNRGGRPADAVQTARWVIDSFGDGVVALGLGGPEVGYPPENFTQAFDMAAAAGVTSIPHAGETEGPASIWGALRALRAVRIGHGVRCLEDPALVAELRARQIPLEVCPTSNVCLGVFPSMAEHALPRLLDEGLYVTINSDDPPMFNTTLTGEYLAIADTFGFSVTQLEQFVLNAVRVTRLPFSARAALERQFLAEFARLRAEYLY